MSKGLYVYLTVPWKYVPPVFNRWQRYTIYASVESDFRTKLVAADILKLIDGTVIYRVLRQYLFRFKFDSRGYFMTLPGYDQVYFSDDDPSLKALPVKSHFDWVPI